MADERLAGRVAIVTGAGRGIGREHALTLARFGARVVVNDFGGSITGLGCDSAPAEDVVREIIAAGGEAIADASDIGLWAQAEALVARTVATFGTLDILVNNAGILRPRTIVGMSEDEMTLVVRVHLLGSFAMMHFAAQHWRARYKDKGITHGRLINTTSGSGLYALGQANYVAAKAGVAAMTAVAAVEFERYGATANAVSPSVVTRMSGDIVPDNFTPDHVAELVCWLSSVAAQGVTGRVFQVGGGHIAIVDRCHVGASIDRHQLWTVRDLDAAMPGLLARAKPDPDLSGYYPNETRSPVLPEFRLPRGDQ